MFAKLGQGQLGVVSTLLQFCDIRAIRETRRVKFCQKQTIEGPLTFLTLHTQNGIQIRKIFVQLMHWID